MFLTILALVMVLIIRGAVNLFHEYTWRTIRSRIMTSRKARAWMVGPRHARDGPLLEGTTDKETVAFIARHDGGIMIFLLRALTLLCEPSATCSSPVTHPEVCFFRPLTLNSGTTLIFLYYHWTLYTCAFYSYLGLSHPFPMMYIPFVFAFYDAIVTPSMQPI